MTTATMAERVSFRCLKIFLLLYTIFLVLFLSYYFTGSWRSLLGVPAGRSDDPSTLQSAVGRQSPLGSYRQGGGQTSVSSTARLFKVLLSKNASLEIKTVVNSLPGKAAAKNTTTTTTTTKSLRVPLSSERDFQPVHHKSIFVYSAYYNSVRRPPEVTVVAVVNRSAMAMPDATPVRCVYRTGGAAGTTVSGELTIFPDHHGQEFSPGYIHCLLPDHLSLATSTTVSISTPRDQGRTNILRVQLPQPRRYNFLICFSPLHRNFGDATLVVENLEMAQVLGAQHAVVYNTSITAGVDTVLRHYVRRGFLDVVSWRDPPEPVHYKAQMGAINDCLLRNLNSTDFIVFMDFDEMIVPRVHDSWSALVQAMQNSISSDFVHRGNQLLTMAGGFVSRLAKKARGDAIFNSSNSQSHIIGAFSFPSSVFLRDKATNLTNEELRFANRLHLSFLLKQRRTVELWQKRSKTIVNPRTVNIMGIHRVIYFLGEENTLLVNESLGLLQHYRWYGNVPSVKDTNILRFASTLVQRMKHTLKELDSEH